MITFKRMAWQTLLARVALKLFLFDAVCMIVMHSSDSVCLSLSTCLMSLCPRKFPICCNMTCAGNKMLCFIGVQCMQERWRVFLKGYGVGVLVERSRGGKVYLLRCLRGT